MTEKSNESIEKEHTAISSEKREGAGLQVKSPSDNNLPSFICNKAVFRNNKKNE